MAGELEAAHDIGVHDVAGDAHREDVAEALVEDELGRRAAVDAAHDRGEGPLAVTRLVGLLQQVAVDAQVADEARVAFLQDVERARGGDGGLRFEVMGSSWNGSSAVLTNDLAPRGDPAVRHTPREAGVMASTGLLLAVA